MQDMVDELRGILKEEVRRPPGHLCAHNTPVSGAHEA